MRPGLYGWMVQLEYTMFKPDTDANDGFHLMICRWPESEPIEPLTIVVISIDKRGQAFADKTLWNHGLRKVRPGFTIATMTPQGQEQFFLTGPNVFVLENHSQGAEHVVYSNDPVLLKKARDHEAAYCDRFFEEHKKWLETPEGMAEANAYWAKHPSGRVY